ncbi:MAG TPA: selenocysteine-specific translation elongation factor [Pirellulaceae bacterium]|nr:selenocysteine-specific translation elongation factor [Pirellulaceae bacterium]
MATDLILGTAGHIDHGKTSLIRALTGIDTDRLPEEKRRGITIDLGFAHLELDGFRLGIVDVPGHEKFVRNMLAGATGMDLAMLVVAADDSIKQQTREHLEILRMLDLRAGVIVITKCDLADPGWTDLVADEVRTLVQGTFLADAPIVRTSVPTGQGLDDLKRELRRAAERARAAGVATTGGPFRMAIDRTFSVAGHGTVVTGSVASGCVNVGDELLIEPGGIPVRVRGLQSHDKSVDEVHRGQRAAINLAGIHHDAIRRGHELAQPGHLRASKIITAQLMLLGSSPLLKSRMRVRVHVGTAEILATVALLEHPQLLPGQSAPIQLFLAESAVTTWNQPLVVRNESPVATIGGGRVLNPNAERLRRPESLDLLHLGRLRSSDPWERSGASLFFAGLRDWQPADLPRLAGVEQTAEARKVLLEKGELREIAVSPMRTVRLHSQVVERLGDRVAAALATLHERNPLRTSFPRAQVAAGFQYVGDAAVLDAVLETMRAAGRIRLTDSGLALAGHGPKLSRNEQALLTQLAGWFREAGLESPTVKDCQQRSAKNQASVPQLVQLLVSDGELVEIAADYFLHASIEADARQKVAHSLAGLGLTLSEIREILGTSRKYAVPLCEYWDRVGFTSRQGDLRTLRK